jgi:hypothetical protein
MIRVFLVASIVTGLNPATAGAQTPASDGRPTVWIGPLPRARARGPRERTGTRRSSHRRIAVVRRRAPAQAERVSPFKAVESLSVSGGGLERRTRAERPRRRWRVRARGSGSPSSGTTRTRVPESAARPAQIFELLEAAVLSAGFDNSIGGCLGGRLTGTANTAHRGGTRCVVELSPRLSLRRPKTACPEPTPANSLDRGSIK